ncbi:MAG TPA: hypothetical protein VLI39_20535 [Sedimentisphaerales bacterium]|nr:hypothetical protein [Sedimentisphaerales bacterium]
MKIGMIGVVAAGILLVGCASSHMPMGTQIVGGGLMVDWTAPANGTVILAEAVSGKIVRTESVNEGGVFEFEPTTNSNAEMLNGMFGGVKTSDDQILAPLPKNSRFVLYFLPAVDSEQ